tara:strand:+ start:1331 stop:2170 length:840 start_codon:yes stop_codon:yes gene_type:complete
MSIKIQKDLLVSSSPDQGALNLSEDGSSFEVKLEDAITIPDKARNIKLEVQRALVWNNMPNIYTGVNDKIYINGPNTEDVQTSFVVTIAQGSYDLQTLTNDILADLEVQGAKTEPLSLISLDADVATGKVEVSLNYPTVQIEMRSWNTFHKILGLNEELYTVPTGKTTHTFLADNVANFAAVESILVHSDITSKGLSINGQYSQTVAQILPDVRSGSLIVFQPLSPLKIDCDNLKGTNLESFRVWLTNEKNEAISTNGEYYSMLLKLSFERNQVFGLDN